MQVLKMTRKIIIFLGLSIFEEEAATIIDADFRPPVRRGDVLKAINDGAEIIGIIDGVFHQSPAVAHKEIMKAMDLGVTVVGGCSMGALRASELDDLGMIGVGEIYRMYRNGTITSDDDVAVAFDPDTRTTIGEALVNIEYKLGRAMENEFISEEEKEEIIKIAKELYYPQRSYANIFSKVEMEDERKSRLIDFIVKEKDLKYLDAVAVLERIKEIADE